MLLGGCLRRFFLTKSLGSCEGRMFQGTGDRLKGFDVENSVDSQISFNRSLLFEEVEGTDILVTFLRSKRPIILL